LHVRSAGCAFFIGLTSSPGPLQIFHPAVTNNLILFPTGTIALFLVPGAIFFHTLFLLNYWTIERQTASETRDQERKPQ
jgi:hypothetical protein